MAISEHTFNDLLDNPTKVGMLTRWKRYLTGDPLRASRERLVQMYREASSRGSTTIRSRVFKGRKDRIYLVYCQVPSSGAPTVKYDCLIELDFTESSKGIGIFRSHPVENAHVRLYVNSPSWIYFYAFVAGKLGLIIPEYRGATGALALTEDPVIRNPDKSLGFEKVSYFTLLHIKGRYQNEKTLKREIGPSGSPPRPGSIDATDKLMERDREGKKIAEGRRKRRQPTPPSITTTDPRRKGGTAQKPIQSATKPSKRQRSAIRGSKRVS